MNVGVAEIEKLLREYQSWLRDRTMLRQVSGEYVEITTPYMDRHNDMLQIYARRENGGFVLTDDSYTIHDLEASGCALSTGKRQDLLRMTLNGFGVRLNNEALEVRATAETFSARKHNLIQAMLAVNDLFYLAKPVVENLFFEDVIAWLDSNEIRFTPHLKLPGITGYDHSFSFVIPKSRKQPERVLQAITLPTRERAHSFIHAWNDTRPNRTAEAKAYAVLNDVQQPVPSGVLDAFRNYEIVAVPWGARAEIVTELAA